jgi:hypothetical protein
MGGNPSIETTADQKVRVQISLPLKTAALPSSEIAIQQGSVESNGKPVQPSNSDGAPMISSKNGK